MPVMEISIKWNVCRICLAEERRNYAKYNLIDSKIAKQIYDIAGVQMDTSDNLPDKICRKCLLLLKYACHFSTTCRNSDEYLRSVIQKTKSATSMLKMDKRRERSVELLEEMFNEDAEVISPNEGDEEQRESATVVQLNKNDIKLASSTVSPEKIGDCENDDRVYQTQLLRTIPSTSTVLRIQQSNSTFGVAGTTTSYVITKEDNKKVGNNSVTTSNKKYNKIHKEGKNYDHDYIDQEFDENELDDFDDSKASYKRRPLRVGKSISECSMDDLGYIDGNEEKQTDALNIITDHNECSLINADNNKIDETDSAGDCDIKFEKEKLSSNSEDEHVQETDELFYIIDEPVIKEEESSNLQSEDVDVDADADAEADDNIQFIDVLAGTDACEYAEEPVYDNCETNRSMVQLEEYLIDESDSEPIVQQELDLKGEQTTEESSSTTIKARDREHRGSPHSRRKGNDSYMFSCEICGNHFTSRSLRNYHMRIHRKEKNFECELCFKRFTAACNLTAHMRIHTGEKPYECKFCLRRFTDRSTHVKHERVHTNEKPFQCNTCGKSFALSTTLRTHEKVHTNEKPFKCEPCNKSFKLPHQLKSHLHTNQHKSIVMTNELKNSEYEKCN